MKRFIAVLFAILCLQTCSLNPALAQESDSNWTEFKITAFDKVDGDFSPRLSGAIVNFINNKGIGAFLGEGDRIGPLTMWKVWEQTYGEFRVSFFMLASTDVSDVDSTGLFANATIGGEPRVYWKGFGNAELALGLLSTEFVEGEKAEWTPYFSLVFRP